MKLITLSALLVIVTANPVQRVQEVEKIGEKEWWQNAVFYQIYPRSFQDSDGDGNGDLNGIRMRIPYIKSLGVTSIWLSPIFPSPMVDGGYDISDFRGIDPIFGTLADFDELLSECHKNAIKVVLDFVPNHSSDQHEWFEKSIKRIDPYTNYYVWADGKIVNGTRQPPSNWISEFHGSAWEWNEDRGQYYLHQFAVEQPDLNYKDPALVEEMKNVLRFWMDRGVDGFRVDTIPHLFEEEGFPDQPLSNDPGCLPVDRCYLEDIYSKDRPPTFDMVIQWRNVLKQYATETDKVPRVMMTEAYSPLHIVVDYYGNKTHDGASFTFNFWMIRNTSLSSNAWEIKAIIDNWMAYLPEGRTSNWVLGNHDNHRVGNRFGKERTDALNILILTLPGVGVTYNGEEFGQLDGFVSWEDTQDPNAINAGKDRYLDFTRDPERTPLQWDDSLNAGFSNATKTWLPVSEAYTETNVKKAVESLCSHYHVYVDTMNLRQSKTLQHGSLTTQAFNSNVLAIVRFLEGEETFISLMNLGNGTEIIDLHQIINFPDSVVVRVSSVGAQYQKGFKLEKGWIKLEGYEAYVFSG